MHLLRFLNSFIIYNILLILFFSFSVNGFPYFPIINLISYIFFHFLIIYLGIYYYRKTLFIIYFIYGLGLDVFWIDEIGPHLLVFTFFLIIFNFIKKYLYYLDALRIYLFLLGSQIIIILLIMINTKIMFGYDINFNDLIKILILSILISYPAFNLFSKIDKYR